MFQLKRRFCQVRSALINLSAMRPGSTDPGYCKTWLGCSPAVLDLIQNLILYPGLFPSVWSVLFQPQCTPVPLPVGRPLGTVSLSYSLTLWMLQQLLYLLAFLPSPFVKLKEILYGFIINANSQLRLQEIAGITFPPSLLSTNLLSPSPCLWLSITPKRMTKKKPVYDQKGTVIA